MSSVRLSRPLLAVVWLSLFLVGCLSQFDLVKGPQPGADDTPAGVLYTKKPVNATGSWAVDPDGRGRVALNLAPMAADPVKGRFRVKDVVTSQINQIRARITGPGIATAIVPAGADATGLISPFAGSGVALNFSAIPAGKGRILTVEGLHNGAPVSGAVVRTLFDMGASGSGSFEVSQATTPAASLYMSLPATIAAVTTADSLNALINQITGRNGSYPTYTFTTHPSLVNLDALTSALVAANGSTAGLTPSSFRMPGATVSATFRLSAAGSPTANDRVTVWMSDPASSPLVLPHHVANTPAVSAATGTVSYTIHEDNRVDVSFHGIPPAAGGGFWTIGASLPTDGSGSPNVAYYANQTLPGIYSCGNIGMVPVSLTDAAGGLVASAAAPLPLLDPKFVPGEIRWRDDSAPLPVALNYEGNLASLFSGLGNSASSDKTLYVGPTTAAVASYTLSSPLNLAQVGARLAGPPPELGLPKPQLDGAGPITIGGATTGISGLHLQGLPVEIGTGGGVLSHLTVAGISGSSGTVAAISGNGSGGVTLSHVHVYDVAHTGSASGGMVAGIHLDGDFTGTMDHVLVDDKGGIGAAMAVRPTTDWDVEATGILLTGNVSMAISHSQAIRIGYSDGNPGTANRIFGIASRSQQPVTVSQCTVSDLHVAGEATGIAISAGTVQDSEVRQMRGLAAAGALTGIRVASADGATGNVTVQRNLLRQLGVAGDQSRVTAIDAFAPGAATLTVSANTISGSQGAYFTGVGVSSDGQGDETIVIADNVLALNSNENGSGSFTGIATPAEQASASITVQGNDLSYNTAYGAMTGIGVMAMGGTVTVQGNNVGNNTMRVGSGSSSADWTLIDVGGDATATTISGNLLRGNQVFYDNGASNGSFAALSVHGSSSGAPQIVNNLIADTSLNVAASSFGLSATMIRAAGVVDEIRSNRIHSTGLTGAPADLVGTSWHAIAYAGTEEHGTAIDHNIIFEPAMGQYIDHRAVRLFNPSSWLGLRHNSIYVGHGYNPIVWAEPSSHGLEMYDNVLSVGSTPAAPAAVLYDSPTGLSGYNNTVYGWAAMAFNGSTSVSLSQERLSPAQPFVVNAELQLISGEKPPTPGTGAYSGSGVERGAYGGTGLETAPAFTSTVVAP